MALKDDLVLRIGGDLKGLSGALSQAEKIIVNGKQKIEVLGGAWKSAIGTIGKAVPAFNALGGAMEFFNGLVSNSQLLGDSWAETMQQCTSVVDSFFSRISTGDFTGWLTGLSETARLAKDAYQAIDALGTAELFEGVDNAGYEIVRKQIERQLAQAELDGNQALMKELKEKLDIITGQQNQYMADFGATALESAQAQARQYIQEALGGSYNGPLGRVLGDARLERYASVLYGDVDEYNALAEEGKRLNDEFGKLNAQRLAVVTAGLGGVPGANTGAELRAIDEQIAKLKELNPEWRELIAIANVSDEKIQKVRADYLKYQQTQISALDQQTKDLKQAKEIDSKTTVADNTEALNRRLLESENRLALAELTVIEDKGMREIAIMQRTHEQKVAQYRADYESAKTWQEKLIAENLMRAENLSYTDQLNSKTALTGQGVSVIPIMDEERIRKEMQDSFIKDPIKIQVQADIEKLKMDLDETANLIQNCGQLFNSLGDVSGNEMLNIAGVVAGAVAKLLEGYAMATAKAGKLGPIGWASFAVAGLAEVAGVIAQVKSMAKFADGGIVGGASSVGDFNIARVNAGEMIMNGSQQAKLWRMINQPTAEAHGARQSGEIKVHIEGKDLVGVLGNYNRMRRY